MRVSIIIYVKKIIKLIKILLISFLYSKYMFNILFPRYCVGCGKLGDYLCKFCQKKLKNNLPECYICRRISNRYKTHKECNINGIDYAFVGWQYDVIPKKILSEYKYRYAYKLAEILSSLMIKRLEDTGFANTLSKDSIIVPIPIHRSHKKIRGFNQSALIGRELASKLDLKFDEGILERNRDGSHQSKASFKERVKLKDVFILRKDIKKKNIILLDDVISTGTTINRAAQKLKGNSIKAIALFRGRPRYQ